MATNMIVDIKNMSVSYSTSEGFVRAVDEISFSVMRGEVLGLAGESGCGKTTTALAIMGLLSRNARVQGQILFGDRDILTFSDSEFRAFRWKEVSIVTQSSMNALDPVIPVGNQIVEAIQVHEQVENKIAWERTKKLLSLVSIHPSRAKNYPHEFSGGMKQRVVIAMALALQPKLVIADEPTTALDVVIQKQILLLLKDLQRRLNVSFLIVSHDLSVIGQIADRVAIMYAGKIAEIGVRDEVLHHPSHPYTEALLGSLPQVFGPRQQLSSIPGNPPTAIWPSGCRFHPRCKYSFELCKKEEPKLFLSKTGALASCHLLCAEHKDERTRSELA